jgi:hypothetical protein
MRTILRLVNLKGRELGRQRRRWEDNIRMDIGELGWEGVDRIHLAQERDQWRALLLTVMNLQFPGGGGGGIS